MIKSTQRNNQKGSSAVLTIILVILVIALTGLVVFFWQSYEKERELNLSRLAAPAEAGTNKTSGVATPASAPTATKRPTVVVYTPNGLFNEAEITELKTKYINPFTDWNTDNNIATVSITVEKPYPAISGYKYKVNYINEDASSGGFLYGTTTPLEWWLPECLGGCNFSDSFKAKYTEIVAKLK